MNTARATSTLITAALILAGGTTTTHAHELDCSTDDEGVTAATLCGTPTEPVEPPCPIWEDERDYDPNTWDDEDWDQYIYEAITGCLSPYDVIMPF